MNNRKTISIITFLLIFISVEGFAQFSLSGEIRPRSEYSHGYGSLAGIDQKPSLFTSQRARLNFFYKSDKIETKLVIQDVEPEKLGRRPGEPGFQPGEKRCRPAAGR